MSENETENVDKSERIFNKFIDVVKSRITETDKQKSVPEFLRKKYEKADNEYTGSKSFRSMILEHLVDIKKRRGALYKHIHEVVSVLNAAKRRVVEENVESNIEENDENKGEGSNSVENKKKKRAIRKKEKKQKRRIKRLELHLKDLSKEIKQYEEKELSLDDMAEEESDYIMENKLKLRFNRVWEKLCELKNVPTSTGRVTEQYLLFEETRFPEINLKLEKLLNKPEFPNFNDVLSVVRKVNNKKELHLTEREVSNIAEKSFKIIGNRLQQRREVDLAYNFGSHMTEDFKVADDPAKRDIDLSKKLRDNHKVGQEKLDNCIKTFSEKQENVEDSVSTDEEPPKKRNKLDSSCESEDESEKEEYEEMYKEIVLETEKSEESEECEEEDGEVETSSTCDFDDVATASPSSSQCTDDDQFLPEHISHLESIENFNQEPKPTNIYINKCKVNVVVLNGQAASCSNLVIPSSPRESSTKYKGSDGHTVSNDKFQEASTSRTVGPSSTTDENLMGHIDMKSMPSPQEVTSSTSPKHLSEVRYWYKEVIKKPPPEVILLSSSDSDESLQNTPIKRINHMVGGAKFIPPPVSSEDEDCIVLSD